MKVSYGIFLVGIILSVILVFLVQSDLGNSDHLMYGLVSEDVYDKIITLYFFIIIIKFFFGGIVYLAEREVQDKKILFSDPEFELDEGDLNDEYRESIETRSRNNPFIDSNPFT